jgi:hypothetical protein
MQSNGEGYRSTPMGHSKCIHDAEGDFFEPFDEINKQEYIQELEDWKKERRAMQEEIDILKIRLTKI